VEFLSRNTPDFIAPSLWPPNSPDLNPVNYQVWSALQQRIDSQCGTVEKNSDRRVAPFPTGNHWQCHQAMACSIEGVCSWKWWPLLRTNCPSNCESNRCCEWLPYWKR